MIPIVAGIIIAVFIIVFVYALIKGTKDFDRLRAETLDEFAAINGFASGDAHPFNLREKIRNFSIIGVAENTIAHAAWKDVDGVKFYVFDQVRVTKGGSSTRGGLLTICLAEAGADLGPDTVVFTAQSRMEANLSRSMAGGRLGLSSVTFGDKDFDNGFVVFSQAPNATRRVFNDRFKIFLKTETKKISMPVTIQIRGNRIAVHNTGDRPKTMKKAEEIYSLYVLAKGVLNALCA